MIIPLYKPLGASTHQLAQKAGQLYQAKATHTGTLDPLAEGVVIVLTGEDRFQKSTFSEWKKQYHFKIAFGVSTDSHDLLGKITATADTVPPVTELKTQLTSWLQHHQGTWQQTVPAFSARRVDGQSSFELAKQNVDIPTQAKEVTLFANKVHNQTALSAPQLSQQAIAAINTVSGDFRQQELLEQWQQFPTQTSITFPEFSVSVTTSKRLYVRGIVRDIGQNFSVPAVTTTIIRTANGEYSIEDCTCLV